MSEQDVAGSERQKFPPTFYYANAIELFERLAFYGFYIGLTLYLHNVVGFSDIETGVLVGNFRFVGAMAPIFCGAIADKITFKRSLIVAFVGYSIAYGWLLASPTKSSAYGSLMMAAVSGGFMKPVITGTVIRTSPPGQQTRGFAIFYRMINTGSVVGKSLAFIVRRSVALRFVTTTSVIASLVALGIAVFGYKEPSAEDGKPIDEKEKKNALGDVLRGYAGALGNLKIVAFLLIFSGFYFMSEQFYMTFPTYVTRHIDRKAPLEIITLVNPALIAIGQLTVTRFMKRVKPIVAMTCGVLTAATSMLVMGAVPNLAGACLSGAIFACAEMMFSPRFYDYLASFAPKGKAGLYMGLAFIPFAIGGWVGGQASGRLIALYMPAVGPRLPFSIWSTYAALGLGCAVLMVIYGFVTKQIAFGRGPPAVFGGAFDAVTRPLWTANVEGPRTVEEAVELAGEYGVVVPDDIRFVTASLSVDRDAQYGGFLPSQDVRWADFYTDTDDPFIPVRISDRVLASDIAIVAVFAHELFELDALRDMFAKCGTMKGTLLDLHVSKDRRHNLHWDAWKHADERVIAMLQRKKDFAK